MSFRPTGTSIFVRRKQAAMQTNGGIYLPKDVRDVPCDGTVLAVGPKVEDINPGDVAIFPSYVGTELDVDDQTILVIDEKDILLLTLVADG